ncbi:MAG: hypothetical protein ACFFCW_38005 [Candidatus Hodarchaeota archaeon]
MNSVQSACYWCVAWKYKIAQPHRVCPNRITKALKLFPRCIFCNLEGSGVEGIRKRFGWSKREMARQLGIPWKTYQEISTFKRSGKRSDIYSKIQELIDRAIESPGKYITQEMIQEITTSPLDFFNKYIGEFPWEQSGKWPSPVWPGETKIKPSNRVGAKWPKVAIAEKERCEIGVSTAL